jgi:hypothetical protein
VNPTMGQTSPDTPSVQPVQTFPRRDAAGRVRSLAELAVAAGLGTVVGLAALAAIEGILALIGLTDFGSASGWLALILPGLLYFDDLRAWRRHGEPTSERGTTEAEAKLRHHGLRFLVAPIGLGVALGAGLLAAGVANALPAMLSGAVGALVAALVYAPVWFLGIRLVTGAGDGREDAR